jgi:hypothetical protein
LRITLLPDQPDDEPPEEADSWMESVERRLKDVLALAAGHADAIQRLSEDVGRLTNTPKCESSTGDLLSSSSATCPVTPVAYVNLFGGGRADLIEGKVPLDKEFNPPPYVEKAGRVYALAGPARCGWNYNEIVRHDDCRKANR